MFFTTVALPSVRQQVFPNTPMLFVGSCFSDEIGGYCKAHKLNVLCNPFGVLFNPISLFDLLGKAISQQMVDEQLLVVRNDVWLHLGLHSDCSALHRADLLHDIQSRLRATYQYLTHTPDTVFLFITFGTAWVYRHGETQQIVANCHKLPARYFVKELLTVSQIVQAYEQLAQLLPPNARVVLTVSPVRHTKDTLSLNSVSKAVLRLACYEITSRYPEVCYFPAYEILVDELRDYRFYAKDLIHPNEQAVEYIYQQFARTFFDTTTHEFVSKWETLRRQLGHRSFHPMTKEHQQFLKDLLQKLITLQAEYPQKDFSEDIARVQSQIL